MKTIIHVTLSDLERGHLANAWFGRKALVTRNEVNDFVQAKIQLAMLEGERKNENIENDTGDAGRIVRLHDRRGDEQPTGEVVQGEGGGSDPGNEGPTAAGLATACRRVIQHIDDGQADDTLNLGWCASILLATGIQ